MSVYSVEFEKEKNILSKVLKDTLKEGEALQLSLDVILFDIIQKFRRDGRVVDCAILER